MNYSYRNYTAVYGRSHVSATIRNRKSMKENNTAHDSNDAAIVSMAIHTLMNWKQV